MSLHIVSFILLICCSIGLRPVFAAETTAQLEAKLKQRPDDMRTRYALAEMYARENKGDKTIELLNSYTDQLDDKGFILLAMSYSNKRDFTNEVRVLNFAVSRDEENYRWHMLLAQAYIKQANAVTSDDARASATTSGIQRLRRVLQLEPKYKPAFDLLLTTFLKQRSNNEARELLIEGISKFGRRPEFFRELCRLDSQDGFLVQAVSNCQESIKISPEYPDHYVFLVQALHDQKEDVRAEKTITIAARRFPNSEFVQWAAGTLFLRKKNYPVATRYFEAAAKAGPNSGRAQFGLAQARFEDGDAKGALEPFIRACKYDASTLDTFLAATGRLKQKAGGRAEGIAGEYVKATNSCR
jgi:predicted Zn-dependent protease